MMSLPPPGHGIAGIDGQIHHDFHRVSASVCSDMEAEVGTVAGFKQDVAAQHSRQERLKIVNDGVQVQASWCDKSVCD